MTDRGIETGDRVLIHYTMCDASGETIDASNEDEPLAYVHGHGQIIPGLERALDGSRPGHETRVEISAEDGYGPHVAERVIDVPRASFEFEPELHSVVEAQLPNGHSQYLQVVGLTDDTVTLDGNHPLAGRDLVFDVTVVSFRSATAEELDALVHPPGFVADEEASSRSH
jgi:FKBP-type peptidyl-prolyl cis-trans isomerase SlyD